MTSPAKPGKQLLHLVFGGELNSLKDVDFKDLSKLDVVGFFPDYASAYQAWLGKARETIDQAQTRYFIVHLHRLLDPSTEAKKAD
ncbi:DUF4170 domain-containing protein [Aestuariivirga sp.]|uniref:DUF4170 domain-containing protein n=1 Tax=Aestuariivirga sp. TaxID=2650926 RepID=UPI0039E603F0